MKTCWSISIFLIAFVTLISAIQSTNDEKSSSVIPGLFYENGILNLQTLNEQLSQCEVVQTLNKYAEEESLEEAASSSAYINQFFDLLFPFGPAGNALLATAYISGPPNLVLAFVPASIDVSSLSLLVSFATGGLLGDVFLHLLPETFFGEGLEDKAIFTLVDGKRNTILGVFIFIGFLIFFIIDKLLRILEHTNDNDEISGSSNSHSHSHSHSKNNAKTSAFEKEEKEDSKLRSRKQKDSSVSKTEDPVIANPNASIKNSAYLNLISDFTHNITDGLAIAASFYISRNVGATTTLAVFVHEFPHEMGDFALLIQGGFTKWQAMYSQFITAVGAFLGTFIGISIQSSIFASTDISEQIANGITPYSGLFGTTVEVGDLTLPFTAGGFLYIATVGVIPEVLELDEGTTRFQELKKFAGQLIMLVSIHEIRLMEESYLIVEFPLLVQRTVISALHGKVDPNAKEVIVTGDFDNWSRSVKLDFKPEQNKFVKKIKFNKDVFSKGGKSNPDDKIFFKFIVDGQWQINPSPMYKVETSNSNIENNFIFQRELQWSTSPPSSEALPPISATTASSSSSSSSYTELLPTISKSETATSDYTTISTPRSLISDQISPPVVIEHFTDGDNEMQEGDTNGNRNNNTNNGNNNNNAHELTVINSEVTLTGQPAFGGSSIISSSSGAIHNNSSGTSSNVPSSRRNLISKVRSLFSS
ncbi:hypothetical protein PACTADRAFT_18708 [Pachysolen tannophilus NRRL Y-2460]|uniref:AMP-activated protein kinase glycogen-binding domain-containing protein n=1 Tax=Pachysolen tannophilus NRRL Y-2460 TaxID=669874 RepID=A0A1E4TNA3_PACTA|nr:hypothetical protein PACTADRAFT_18708 [Pachysolen tannophilus NRRL Y-2460]